MCVCVCLHAHHPSSRVSAHPERQKTGLEARVLRCTHRHHSPATGPWPHALCKRQRCGATESAARGLGPLRPGSVPAHGQLRQLVFLDRFLFFHKMESAPALTRSKHQRCLQSLADALAVLSNCNCGWSFQSPVPCRVRWGREPPGLWAQ